MRDTAPSTPLPGPHVPLVNRLLQPASPTVVNMDDSLNNTKELQRKSDSTTDESMLENSSAISLESTHNGDSDLEPMDISKTTAIDTSDGQSDCSSPSNDYKKYFCPICDITLISQHEFTLHIRSHNNDNEIITEKGFTCRICSKVLSSSSSLDRHVLVHSGERPFKCKLCAVTFTTNGNMHRHMRTHTQKPGENYESDGSTDSNISGNSGKTRKRPLEFNNNKLVDNSNKRKSDCFEEDDNGNRRKKNFNNNNINELQKYHCPVCDREDFASLNVFETHLEDNHPEYEVSCITCNLSFKNHRALNLHRHMSHNSEQVNNINNKAKNAHLGFKDLTFVDFSSDKFPHIARYACEKSLHKPVTTQKFICDKCVLAFPCSTALQMHQDECLKSRHHLVSNLEYPTDLSRKTSDEEIRRDNFFAHLDLQNKSPPTSPISDEVQESRPDIKPVIDSKDLADIQSILSMTSNGSLLQHLRTKPQTELIPLPQETIRTPEQHPEEESQDIFAAEFRKMKLRGEFPCRLCTAVFPNLRALKGHNRAHLNGNGNTGPYRCNMCPHSSIDKAALIRHMRTHNGDRPYECALCNYAFTTKANCERHLRNRHAKTTREEVKKNIIYHPSEDPTNDEVNKLNASRDMKHHFLNNSTEDELPEKLINSTPIAKDRITPEIRNMILPQALGITIPPLIPNDLLTNSHSPILAIKKDLMPLRLIPKEEKLPFPFPKPPSFSYKSELPEKLEEPKIQLKCFDNLKQIPDYDTQSDDDESNHYDDHPKVDHPIDLSMDVLDLSKKKEQPKEVADEPQDFTKRTLESAPLHPSNAAQLLLAQQLFKSRFYPNPLSLYQHPTLFPPHPYQLLFPQTFMNTQDIKERMLSLQLSGGNIINDQYAPMPNGFQALHQQAMSKMQDMNYQKDDEIKPPLHINTQLGDSVKLQSPKPKTPDMIHSPNSVKMVIKNGVLMPKQKQRRYRTERPFSCEHCSARFTLRSNMERHIKQQHPQFWSQRQRSGITPTGRKPTPPQTSTKPPFYELNVPNYDLSIPKLNDSLVNETKEMLPISQQVKYAILAQKLKAHTGDSNLTIPSKDEDEDALIIDEELSRSEVHPMDFSNEHKPRSLEEKMLQLRQIREKELKLNEDQRLATIHHKSEEVGNQDLVPVSRLLDNAVSSQLPFREYFRREGEENEVEGVSEEDEEGLVASGSTSEGNGSGSDENKSENDTPNTDSGKKKSAYSLAPNRVSCPYCHRKFPWTSSLRRHVLTHTGQKPFKCSQCPLLFTTKSNCDRHLLRKHGNATNPETTTNNNNNNNNNSSNQNYMMRNVPERPYKCSSCPSSTFSTLSNLKKHMSCKHTDKMDDVRPPSRESFASSEDERKSENKSDWESQISQSKQTIPSSELGNSNSDLPFKCHLCECSYADRQEALDHIKDNHSTEFELLMTKGALDQNPAEELPLTHDTEDDGDLRGKFPDYANRKVMCAFCMRRFWSAEDLRRHMRTHTGERPFSCDICNRRFTLKHSMLRHRKKHNLTNDENLVSGDEEHYDKLKLNNNNNNVPKSSEEDSGAEGNDLIGNLLGIRDKSIIDQVLVSSADDAAKLLGVNHGVNE